MRVGILQQVCAPSPPFPNLLCTSTRLSTLLSTPLPSTQISEPRGSKGSLPLSLSYPCHAAFHIRQPRLWEATGQLVPLPGRPSVASDTQATLWFINRTMTSAQLAPAEEPQVMEHVLRTCGGRGGYSTGCMRWENAEGKGGEKLGQLLKNQNLRKS